MQYLECCSRFWSLVGMRCGSDVLIPTRSARGIDEEEGIGEERLKKIRGGEEEERSHCQFVP